MPGRAILIGASSGGVETLTETISGLPQDLDASLFVVLHVPTRSESVLPQILTRAGNMRAEHAKDNEPVQKGRTYLAPPDFQLLLQNRSVRLVSGPRENNHRPAIGPTFRTAARARQSQRTNSAKIFEKRTQAIERQAKVIQQTLLSGKNEYPIDPLNKYCSCPLICRR